MTSVDENEKLLTHSEVKIVMDEALEKPSVIYTGPEDDGLTPRYNRPAEVTGDPTAEASDPLEELSFEKRATIEHVNNFQRIQKEKASLMIEELLKIDRLNEVHAYKIAEIMPRDETELRVVFAKDRFTLTPEELKQILDIIDSHVN
ncbi:MAG: hypothetical protein JXA22_09580 [Candidatus Thermoplasmatota archaeon]|nr:hypothetical protein [Candidatus Thermoplasmatota archaeon]